MFDHTNFDNRYAKIVKTLNIPEDRYEQILSYVMEMITDYHGNVMDIIKEIPLNLKGNERFFTMLMVGNYTSQSFSIKNDEERNEFITNTTNAMKLNKERATLSTDYITYIIIENIGKVPTVDIIKNIVNSDFPDTEKDFILFILGIILNIDTEHWHY